MLFRKEYLLFIFLNLLINGSSIAQEKDSTLFNQMIGALQKKYFSLSILVRNVADFQPERSFPGNNGFNVENFRIRITGDLDSGFGYHFEAKMINSPAVTDSRLYYKISPAFKMDFGMFKLPFSGEYLRGEQNIDFVSRSQSVVQLNLGKQAGFQLSGETAGSVLSYAAGIFNGNRLYSGNDNNDFLYVGRIFLTPSVSKDKSSSLAIGLNAARSKDKSVPVMGSNFEGDRLVLGGDMILQVKNFMINAEAIYAKLKNVSGAKTNPFGYQVSTGYMLSKHSQILARWDSFREDSPVPFRKLAMLGFNAWPNEVIELQTNYIVPVNDGKFKHHEILFNAQFYF